MYISEMVPALVDVLLLALLRREERGVFLLLAHLLLNKFNI